MIAQRFTRALSAGVAVLAIGCLASATAGAEVERHGGATGSGACGKAKERLSKSKRKLATLRRNGASARAIKVGQQKVKSAKRAVGEACVDPDVLFDVTGVSGKFDATVTRDEESGCSFTEDAHWTAALAPGAGPASLQVYYRDKQGRPVYRFYGPDNGIPWKAKGNGVATRTCSKPPPASNGTVSCNFQTERNGSLNVESDPEGSRAQMTMDWIFSFASYQYEDPANGGACAYSGEFPPSLSLGEVSPGFFASPLNDESNALEPPGFSTIATSSLGGDTTLTFAGSSSAAFGGSLAASWNVSVSLHRR